MKKSLLVEFKDGAKEGARTFFAPLQKAARAVQGEVRRQVNTKPAQKVAAQRHR